VKFDPEGTGFIPTHQLEIVLGLMEPPLGYKNHPARKRYITRYVAGECLPVYGDNQFQFYSVANALASRVY
jgi:hypothetical protein